MVNRHETRLDRIFQALADPTRRRILQRVAKSACTVSELSRPFAISAPAISRHLKVLERAEMLERVKIGRFHRFRVKPRPLDEARQVLEKLNDYWNSRLDDLEKELEREIAESN